MMEVLANLVFNGNLDGVKFDVFVAVASSMTILSPVSHSTVFRNFLHNADGPRKGLDKLWVPCRAVPEQETASQSRSAVALRPTGLWFLMLDRVI
jgi:hypothetical protein